MKISIPKDASAITVEQLQKYQIAFTNALNEKAQAHAAFRHLAKIPAHVIDKMPQKVIEQLQYKLHQMTSKQEYEMQRRFTLNGVEYGLEPDFTEMSFGGFMDAEGYALTEDRELNIAQAHNFLAVLYRPVTKSYDQLYDIEPYNGTKHSAPIMQQAPASIYLGLIAFFLNLQNQLLKDLVVFTEAEAERNQVTIDETLTTNGDGTVAFGSLLTEIYSIQKKYQKFRYISVLPPWSTWLTKPEQ